MELQRLMELENIKTDNVNTDHPSDNIKSVIPKRTKFAEFEDSDNEEEQANELDQY